MITTYPFAGDSSPFSEATLMTYNSTSSLHLVFCFFTGTSVKDHRADEIRERDGNYVRIDRIIRRIYRMDSQLQSGSLRPLGTLSSECAWNSLGHQCKKL